MLMSKKYYDKSTNKYLIKNKRELIQANDAYTAGDGVKKMHSFYFSNYHNDLIEKLAEINNLHKSVVFRSIIDEWMQEQIQKWR